MNAESIARELGGAQRSTDGWWRARCPCHKDELPSFAIKDRTDGNGVLLECFAGCRRNDLVAELRRRGLWPNGTRQENSNASGHGGNKDKVGVWRPFLPVPADAPQPTFDHRRLGRPASAWQYKDPTGRLLGYTARFNKASGGKDVLPYTYCEAADGRREWRWQSFSKPRPLYNLDKLAARPDDWVLVVEGEKTADAAGELFPDHVAITSPGGSKAADIANWLPLEGRKVAIWPDCDSAGREFAEDVGKLARKAGAAKVVVVGVPGYFRKPDGSEGWDVADPPPPGWDVDGLRRLLDEAAFGKDTVLPDFGTLLDEAAGLDSVGYDRRRDQLAEELGIRKSTLDAEVAKRRQERQEEKELFLVEPPAWEQPVGPAALLDGIIDELQRYLVLPEHAPEAIALWILHAHALDAFQCSPILALLSPEKRCGKTTALSVINKLVPKGVFASNTSPAAVYRIIEKWRPTLLVDELDTFIQDNHELRGVINSGHQRSASFVMRVSGDELEPKLYSTWAPKVVAMIGKLPSTLSDRALEVPLKRKRPDERVTRFRNIRPGALPDLKRKAIRWATDNLISLRDAALDVSLPAGLNDRAADNWEVLLAIADRAGGEWPERARRAAIALSGNSASEDASIGVMLLSDIQAIFEGRALTNGDLWKRIKSKELAEALAAIEGRPWAEWKGKPLTKNALARLLKPFSVRPKDLRFGSCNASGYELSAFADAFERYLPPDPPSATPTSPTPLQQNAKLEDTSPTADVDVGVGKPQISNIINDVADVGVEYPPWDEGDKSVGTDADLPWELNL